MKMSVSSPAQLYLVVESELCSLILRSNFTNLPIDSNNIWMHLDFLGRQPANSDIFVSPSITLKPCVPVIVSPLVVQF